MDDTEKIARIRALHEPHKQTAHTPFLTCYGCDADDYSDGATSVRWPCSTALIVYTEEEINTEKEIMLAWQARFKPKPFL